MNLKMHPQTGHDFKLKDYTVVKPYEVKEAGVRLVEKDGVPVVSIELPDLNEAAKVLHRMVNYWLDEGYIELR